MWLLVSAFKINYKSYISLRIFEIKRIWIELNEIICDHRTYVQQSTPSLGGDLNLGPPGRNVQTKNGRIFNEKFSVWENCP